MLNYIFRVENASLATLPNPVPPLYFGGSSAAAGPVAARHADEDGRSRTPPLRLLFAAWRAARG